MKFKMNRLLLAALCVICAGILCFAITPLFNRALQQQVEIIRIIAPVPKGSRLEAAQVERVTVGGYNLPEGVMTALEDCVGKYLTGDVVPGDYLLAEKLSDSPLLGNEYLLSLEEKLAFSVTLKSFAAGLSAKLEPLDVVTVFYTDDASNTVKEAVLPPELQYVKVLAMTNADAVDIDTLQGIQSQEESTSVLPATVTLLVTPQQAQLLASIEAGGKIQLALACRGSKEQSHAKELLSLQEAILESATEEAPPVENEAVNDVLQNPLDNVTSASDESKITDVIVEDEDE